MGNNKTILLVEDDPDILWTNEMAFESEGYDVVTAESIAETLKKLDESNPDLVILDLILPDGNSLDSMPEIRKRTSAPILILTALVEKDERLAGLKAGGDDYIKKPYDIDELCARAAAFLRREEMHGSKPPADTFTYGTITLDLVANQAYVGGESMDLSGKEFAMLQIFVKNEEKTLTKEYLYEAIWKQEMFGDDKPIRDTVYRLRKKLETSNSGYDILSTRREGYIFVEG